MPTDAGMVWRTLLVLFALIVFDNRSKERLLLAGQWLRHGGGRSRVMWTVRQLRARTRMSRSGSRSRSTLDRLRGHDGAIEAVDEVMVGEAQHGIIAPC